MTDTVGALPDPDQVVVPDLPAAIVAYRAWVLDDRGWLLSPMFGRRWPTSRPLDARCEEGSITASGMPPQHYALPSNVRPAARHRYLWSAPMPLAGARVTGPARVRVHPVPCPHHDHATHRGHGCGLYGIRDARELAWRMPAATGHDSNGPLFTVWGEVWLSGQVLEYSEGYRASRATPKALWRPTTPAVHTAAERAAERYGIPLIDDPHPHAAEELEAHVAAVRGAMVTFSQQLLTQLQQTQLTTLLQRVVTPPTAATSTPPPRHRRRQPAPRRRRQPAAAVRQLLDRRHARRWCGGAAAATALLLPAWRRGDLLWWHDRRTLLAAAGTGLLAAAITYGARALHLTRILRKDGPDA